jgi:hypothetical protein
MVAKGFEISSRSVCQLYMELISEFVIDLTDRTKNEIKMLGIGCHQTNIIMKNIADKKALAKFVLDLMFNK